MRPFDSAQGDKYRLSTKKAAQMSGFKYLKRLRN